MYPRNAASPERIFIGSVVQISDGAVQASGVSVTVTPQGGSESAGGGTVAYSARGGVWYTPTQAETNYASFMVEAGKTGCIPVGVTVVTTASATPGYAGVDWSKVTAPTTTLNLSGTTIATTQKVDVETIKTQAVTAAAGVTFPASIGTSTLTQTQVTGGAYALNSASFAFNSGLDLTTTQKASVTTAATAATPTAAAVTGNVGGNVTGTIGGLTAGALADLFDTDSGTTYASAVAGSVVKEIADNAGGSGLTAGDIADAVWDEVLSGHAVSGSTGEALGAAGAAGDPWITALPGSYSAGQAGYIVGTNLDALISSRMATYTQPTGFLAATFPGTVASPTNITAGTITTVTTLTGHTPQTGDAFARLGAPAGASVSVDLAAVKADTGAVKAKTDNLPAAPAATGDCITAAGVRAAVGLASANLDTQLDALPTNAELATALGTADDAVLSAVAAVGATADAILADTNEMQTLGDKTTIRGTVGTGSTPSATQFTPSALGCAGASEDQFLGRLIVFDRDTTTAALRGEATRITASSNASLPLFTYDSLSATPASGDTFTIV